MKKLLLTLMFVVLVAPISFAKKNVVNAVQKSYNYTQADPDSGGPDQWGYTWKRSDEPGGPVFNWLDSANGWQRIAGLSDDNSIGFFNLGFEFPFYWYTVNKLQIGSNGWVSFQNTISSINAAFTQFPNATAPNDVLAPLTTDYDFTDSLVQRYNSRCFFWTNNTDSAIVSYRDVVEWFGNGPIPGIRPRYNFQIIISKSDSSITFQYGDTLTGTVPAFFTMESNVTCGMENLLGNVGLSYYFVDGAAGGVVDPSRYTPGTAVKIKKTVETGYQVVDAALLGGYNADNGAVFLENGNVNSISCYVKNTGTADLSNVRVRHAITRGATTVLRDTVFIASLPAGSTEMVTFPKTFTPAQAGIHSSRFTVDATGDILATNNAKTTETNVLNFIPNSNTTLAFDDGTLDGAGNSSWGFGNEFECPVTVKIESAYVYVQTVGTGSLNVVIVADDGPSGTPGTVLATKTITPTTGFNKVYFGAENIEIAEGHKFYIGEIGTHTFALDNSTPFSNRGWEITSGWGVDRARATQDVMVRAVVKTISTGVPEFENNSPVSYTLEQNFPNPFNPTTNINFSVANRSNVNIKIFDVLGSEIQTLINGVVEAGNHSIVWEGTNSKGISVPSGMYFYQLNVNGISTTKKMVLMK